ncbi:uncharacterized protein LOC123873070 isoform X3 [Maniola jurtina]|uniref:uncharacterized protein LOC123873070 isoform X3 n=1 Tax=Maniola jurtina TaxID=191418 RepID=UPI001E68A858|nr:uncharacterized protein LOC123873070 isoform X3 [Maniola jurtina]
MGVPHITSFCWCFGLEAGTKIIGFAHLLVSLIMMIVCSVFAEGARGYAGTVEDGEDHLYSTWYTITVVVAIISVVHVLLAATLLFATYKRSAAGLRTWVWVMIVLYAASLLYVLVSMTFGFTATGSDIFLAFLQGIVFFGILAYCILCVNSYYMLLKSSEDMEAANKTDY